MKIIYKPKNILQFLLRLFFGILFVFGIFANLNNNIIGYFSSKSFCVFHYITGWYCPGCGMSRAFMNLTIFNFKEAFNFNPFSFLVFYLFIYYAIKGKWPLFLKNKLFSFVLLIVLILFWIVRINGFLTPGNIIN